MFQTSNQLPRQTGFSSRTLLSTEFNLRKTTASYSAYVDPNIDTLNNYLKGRHKTEDLEFETKPDKHYIVSGTFATGITYVPVYSTWI